MSGENDRAQSYGLQLVRASFNPSADSLVDRIKAITAEVIDLVEGHKEREPRLAALAITNYELAAMWAVKMATTAPPSPEKPFAP